MYNIPVLICTDESASVGCEVNTSHNKIFLANLRGLNGAANSKEYKMSIYIIIFFQKKDNIICNRSLQY